MALLTLTRYQTKIKLANKNILSVSRSQYYPLQSQRKMPYARALMKTIILRTIHISAEEETSERELRPSKRCVNSTITAEKTLNLTTNWIRSRQKNKYNWKTSSPLRIIVNQIHQEQQVCARLREANSLDWWVQTIISINFRQWMIILTALNKKRSRLMSSPNKTILLSIYLMI